MNYLSTMNYFMHFMSYLYTIWIRSLVSFQLYCNLLYIFSTVRRFAIVPIQSTTSSIKKLILTVAKESFTMHKICGVCEMHSLILFGILRRPTLGPDNSTRRIVASQPSYQTSGVLTRDEAVRQHITRLEDHRKMCEV